MADARAVKFCTKGDFIKSCQRDDKSPLKGMWFCSRDPFLYVDLENILHGSPLPEINNVVDDGLLLIAPTALEITLRLRPKLHRFDLSSICCKLGCIVYRQRTD